MTSTGTPTPFVGFLILKGESERVPDKNFRVLGDRPLMRWIIDALLTTEGLEHLLIDTDAVGRVTSHLPPDPRIEVLSRPEPLRGHAVTANTLIAPHLDRHAGAIWLMSHATSPFVRPDTLRRAVSFFVEGGRRETIFGATVHQSRFYAEDGRPLNHDPARLVPTQALAPWFEENSSVYVFDKDTFLRANSRLSAGARPMTISRIEAVDIDTEDDFALAATIAAGLSRGAPQ